MTAALAIGVNFSGRATWPKIGSVVTFHCPVRGVATRVDATIATFRGDGLNRIYNLVHEGHVFRAKLVATGGKLSVAPIERDGTAPVSYPCTLKAPKA